MTRKDGLLALLVVVVWGLNFVVIKVGLHNMPPLMLAGLRFFAGGVPGAFCCPSENSAFAAAGLRPDHQLWPVRVSLLRHQVRYACRVGSLVLQAQAFFTIILGAFVFGERLQGKQLAGIALAVFGVLVLIEASLNGQHVALLGFMLTLAALSWACGNIFNKKIMQHTARRP
jgi:O-acetylserine/cysteine efflux transporter